MAKKTSFSAIGSPAVGTAQNFIAVYSDADGYGNIKFAYLLVNAEACPVD